ncbi:MAG: tRNA (N(6)-L-threonylcarbamoyladenosine(37)-C(2))-methylthiotransferase [Candidatus Woesearchaeota archaeon]|nr:tRNA (N(6)-L-threonylcarbamoyladenosine(37)-C(2))-methylthiotransferase [Candidatus Woesearchaeota archaeon]
MEFYIENYGCSANTASGEIIAGLLEKAGLINVENPKNAQIIIINTCIVKAPTEHAMLRRIKLLSETFPEKKIIVAGCLADVEKEEALAVSPNASFLGSHHIREITSLVKKIIKGKSAEITGYANEIKLSLPRERKNPAIAIIPICEGCIGNCAYCIVKIAKGKLFSYPMESVLKEIKASVKSGCREVWITSQDNSTYMLDKQKKSALPELMKGIDSIPGKFWTRIGMMNPDSIMPVLDDLIPKFRSDKVFKFIHIPVQSGSDEVLKRMRRKYTSDDFREIISEFRKKIPKITLSTDIICGFPGEAREQFMESVNLVKEIQPDFLNISRFWAMKGTEALQMKGQINGNETKERSKILTIEFSKIAVEKNRAEIGTQSSVLIDDDLGNGNFIGRTEFYKPVSVKAEKYRNYFGRKIGDAFGQFIDVKITGAGKFSLSGEIVGRIRD